MSPTVPNSAHADQAAKDLSAYSHRISAESEISPSCFPSSFSVYYKSSDTNTSVYSIGETKDSPLLTLITHLDWSDTKPLAVLYYGVVDATYSKPEARMAIVTRDSVANPHTEITVFPQQLTSAEKGISEHLEHHISQKLFTFSFDIPFEKQTRRQVFQWRLSRGSSFKSLEGLTRAWNLVRLPANRRPSFVGVDEVEPEVVATRHENLNWTSSKVAKFRFVGAGATGELGSDWAVMAVMSALRL